MLDLAENDVAQLVANDKSDELGNSSLKSPLQSPVKYREQSGTSNSQGSMVWVPSIASGFSGSKALRPSAMVRSRTSRSPTLTS